MDRGHLDGICSTFSFPDPESPEENIYLPYDTGIPAWLPKDENFTKKFTDIEITSGFQIEFYSRLKTEYPFKIQNRKGVNGNSHPYFLK